MRENERYSRHYQLAGFGKEAQELLVKSSVLIIGAGGLGCPVLQYLVAAGIGKIGIVDHDTIELNNLQRQVLFNTDEVGLSKAKVAAEKLRILNPEVQIQEYITQLSAKNAAGLIEAYDVVVDCTDNFATRYLVSDACMLLDKPLVFGAIFQYEGQVAVFNVAGDNGVKTTYRHLFPVPPSQLDAPDCNTAGVLGVLPGTIGTLQATETIKILTGIGKPLCNRLMTINLLDYTSLILDIPENLSACPDRIPKSLQELERTDYERVCGTESLLDIQTIDASQFVKMADDKDVLIVDVRELYENPRLTFPHVPIPLSALERNLWIIDRKKVVVVCQSGKRSQTAAGFIREKLGKTYQISHLEGGVMGLENA